MTKLQQALAALITGVLAIYIFGKDIPNEIAIQGHVVWGFVTFVFGCICALSSIIFILELIFANAE